MPRDTTRGRTKRRANRGSFKPVAIAGPDARRHLFTQAERRRGGQTTARRYLCTGRWHLDWLDRCDRKVRSKTTGEFCDGEKETDRPPDGGDAGSRD